MVPDSLGAPTPGGLGTCQPANERAESPRRMTYDRKVDAFCLHLIRIGTESGRPGWRAEQYPAVVAGTTIPYVCSQ
jgi:hypothetical protein